MTIMTIWYILCSFGTFFRLWYRVPRRIWQPWPSIGKAAIDRFCAIVRIKIKTVFVEFRPKKEQGCQMVYFQTKTPNLGKFLRVLQWKMLVYFMDSWSILRPIGIFYGHLVMWSFGHLVMWSFGHVVK
jgi:hypothetical protein